MHTLLLAAGFTLGDTLGAAMPTLIQYVLAPSIPLVASGIVWCLVHAGLLLRSKANGNKVVLGIAAVVDFVSNATKHVLDGLAPDIQADLANDGRIDATEKKALLDKALLLVQTELPVSLQGILSSSFGAGVTTWLRGQVSKAMDAHLDDVASEFGGHAVASPAPAAPTTPPSIPAVTPLERPTRP